MTLAEGIIGLLASVITILTGLAFAVRYISKRFDTWAEAVVENSKAMRSLTERVAKLEGAIEQIGS